MMRPKSRQVLACFLLSACGNTGDGSDMQAAARPADFVAVPMGTSALALDAANVYWSEGGSLIRRAAKADAKGATVVDTMAIVARMALDEKRVYWTADSPGSVGSVDKGGGAPMPLANLPVGSAYGIALDGGFVYFTTLSGAELLRVSKAGGDVQMVASDSGNFGSVVVDATRAFYENEIVYSVPPAGGRPTPLDSPSFIDRAALAFDGDSLYEWSSVTGMSEARLHLLSKAGGPSKQLASAAGHAGDMAIAGGTAFCIAGSDILMVPLGGGAATVLAKGEDQPLQIAADATHVYWTTNSAVRRIAR